MGNAPVHVMVHAPAALVWELWAHPPLWDTWHPDVCQIRMVAPQHDEMGFVRDTQDRWISFRLTPMASHSSFIVESRPLPDLVLVFTCTVIAVEGGCIAAQSMHLEGQFADAFDEPVTEFAATHARQALAYLRDLAEFLNEVTSTES